MGARAPGAKDAIQAASMVGQSSSAGMSEQLAARLANLYQPYDTSQYAQLGAELPMIGFSTAHAGDYTKVRDVNIPYQVGLRQFNSAQARARLASSMQYSPTVFSDAGQTTATATVITGPQLLSK